MMFRKAPEAVPEVAKPYDPPPNKVESFSVKYSNEDFSARLGLESCKYKILEVFIQWDDSIEVQMTSR